MEKNAAAARITFPSQNVESTLPAAAFWVFRRLFVRQTRWILHHSKVTTYGFIAGVGRLKKICKEACRVAGAVQETSPSNMLEGADFLRMVPIWSIRSSGLRFCVLTQPSRFFGGQAEYSREMGWKIAKRVCTRLSAAHSAFQFGRNVLQNFFVLEVSTSLFKGNLA